jgi:hypothetical protein
VHGLLARLNQLNLNLQRTPLHANICCLKIFGIC